MKNLMYMKRPMKYDWILLGIVLFLSSVLFCQGDITITFLHSNDLISAIFHGKFTDFYSIVYENAVKGKYFNNPNFLLSANYNILLYFFLAVWLLPLRILYKIRGVDFDFFTYTMWCKLLVVLCIILSIYLIYLIGKKMGFSRERSYLLSYLFGSSSILLFGSAIFGQLDIVTVALILTSLLFYMNKKYIRFCIILSIALCFKGFAIFILVPLLLLSEKRILHLIKYLGISCLFPLITALLFFNDEGYKLTQSKLGAHYGFKERIWSAVISGGTNNISLFIFAIIVICVVCYYLNGSGKNRIKYMIFMPLLLLTSFCIFIGWHPQWVILIVPFISLGIMQVRSTRIAILLEFFMSAGYVGTSVLTYTKNVDNYMLNHGLLTRITGRYFSGSTLNDYFSKLDIPTHVFFTLFAACLVSLIVLIYYEMLQKPVTEESLEEINYERFIVWLRPLMIFGFIILSIGIYYLR